MISKLLHWRLFKATAIAVLVAFVSMIPLQSGYAQMVPASAAMPRITAPFTPTLMTGIRVDLKDPFNLYFVMSDGKKADNSGRNDEYKKLIKYFMAALITPRKDMWVNLSPKEADRIIPDNFAMTEMGRDLLAQDYALKQFTAAMMNPGEELGKRFWDQIYQKAYEKFGSSDIPVDTFNKVWISADKADIYQKNDTAFLVKSHLKVMLEQDFMAIDANKEQFGPAAGTDEGVGAASRPMVAGIVRDVILPVIEQEVNEGAYFAQVRQAYNSMILATWFKKTLKKSLLGQVYADQDKVAGIALNDPEMKERIYQKYLEAYKKGVFNYIREERDEMTQEILPRKYFAGGLTAVDDAMLNTAVSVMDAAQAFLPGQNVVQVNLQQVDGGLIGPPVNQGMVVTPPRAKKLQEKLSRSEAEAAQTAHELAGSKDRIASVTKEAAMLNAPRRWKKYLMLASLALMALPGIVQAKGGADNTPTQTYHYHTSGGLFGQGYYSADSPGKENLKNTDGKTYVRVEDGLKMHHGKSAQATTYNYHVVATPPAPSTGGSVHVAVNGQAAAVDLNVGPSGQQVEILHPTYLGDMTEPAPAIADVAPTAPVAIPAPHVAPTRPAGYTSVVRAAVPIVVSQGVLPSGLHRPTRPENAKPSLQAP
ncbi:MAG: hypothetical protein HQL19_04210, partial [Candidatus Omnitrophica bacterium]|nr:hypothetical protein [Candidatus Omnitrophota bacterium]